MVGNNMKQLEIAEQETIQREEGYEQTIHELNERLKTVRASTQAVCPSF